MSDNKKKVRHAKLAKIINTIKIKDQNQLIQELQREGIKATQATISRDMNEMGVIKVRLDSKNFVFEIAEKLDNKAVLEKLAILFNNFVSDIQGVENQLIIKTSPGNAHGVASLIDRLDWSEIIGTVAGDDTVLTILTSVEDRIKVGLEFQNLI
jgi:transcriptional regulator of arginine metabolism